MAAMLSRLDGRDYSVDEERAIYRTNEIDPDSDFDFDFDERKSQPDSGSCKLTETVRETTFTELRKLSCSIEKAMKRPHYNRDLDVRIVGVEDLPQARQVAGRAYRMHCEDWYGTENNLGGFDRDGTLVCVLDFQPESLWWGFAQIPSAAIECVATDPKHQGRGHAGGLMVQAIHNLRERGYYICPLWPSSYRWYGKFGWVSPATFLGMKVWPDLVRQTKSAPGTVRQATSDDVMAIQRLYTEGARLRNGQSVRSEGFWLKEEILQQLWVLEGESSGLDCSAIVKLEDMRLAHGKKVTVRELHGATFASQLRLVRSLAELDRVVELNLELPAGSLFLQAFPERFDIAIRLTMGLRVLDVEQALAHLKPPDDLRVEVSFEVSDWVIDAGKPLAVTAHAEEGHVEVIERAGKDALRCDINTFTQLFAGGLTSVEARELGRLEGGNPAVDAACDALLAGRVPYRSWVEAG